MNLRIPIFLLACLTPSIAGANCQVFGVIVATTITHHIAGGTIHITPEHLYTEPADDEDFRNAVIVYSPSNRQMNAATAALGKFALAEVHADFMDCREPTRGSRYILPDPDTGVALPTSIGGLRWIVYHSGFADPSRAPVPQ